MTITPSLFEAYLKCPTKCFLRSLGETSTGNECADFDRAQQTSYQTEGIKRLNQTPGDECNFPSFNEMIVQQLCVRLSENLKDLYSLESSISNAFRLT